MNTGELVLTNGDRVYFSSMVVNPWTKKREFLVILNNEPTWLNDDAVRYARFYVGKEK